MAGAIGRLTLLDSGRPDPWKVLTCLFCNMLIATYHDDGNAKIACNHCIKASFTVRLTIDFELRNTTTERMHDCRIPCPGTSVISNEKNTIYSGINTLHHRQRLLRTSYVLDARIQFLRKQIRHVPVRIVHENRTGAGIECALCSSIYLSRDLFSRKLIERTGGG